MYSIFFLNRTNSRDHSEQTVACLLNLPAPSRPVCQEKGFMTSLVGCRLWGRTESDTTEVTQQQQQYNWPYILTLCVHGLRQWSICDFSSLLESISLPSFWTLFPWPFYELPENIHSIVCPSDIFSFCWMPSSDFLNTGICKHQGGLWITDTRKSKKLRIGVWTYCGHMTNIQLVLRAQAEYCKALHKMLNCSHPERNAPSSQDCGDTVVIVRGY